jgi:hypothetical protein
MPSTPIDARKEKALLETLKAISKFLGKEEEYSQFIYYTENREKSKDLPPTPEELAVNTPHWIRWFSVPLGKMYDDGYTDGLTDTSRNLR